MMSEIIQALTEYISIILCLHRLARKNIEIGLWEIIFLLISMMCLRTANKYDDLYFPILTIAYLLFIPYIRFRIVEKRRDVLRVWLLMMVIIPSMQIGMYYLVKMCLGVWVETLQRSIISNILICFILVWWNERHILPIINRIKNSFGILFLSLLLSFFMYLLFTARTTSIICRESMVFAIGILFVLCYICMIIVTAEYEKKSRDKEIQLYKLYNKSFEDAINMIRQRQHEFDNHINAIKSLTYTIDNPDELFVKKNEYCDELLGENVLNKLLKLQCEPIVIGMLYSKLSQAQKMGIIIFQEVHAIDFKMRIAITDLLELLGILIDNAVEALMESSQNPKKLIVMILLERDKKFSIQVANSSSYIANTELEKFFVSGYSTKGNDRGIGLTRAKDIVKRAKGDMSIGNETIDNMNFLCIKIML